MTRKYSRLPLLCLAGLLAVGWGGDSAAGEAGWKFRRLVPWESSKDDVRVLFGTPSKVSSKGGITYGSMTSPSLACGC